MYGVFRRLSVCSQKCEVLIISKVFKLITNNSCYKDTNVGRSVQKDDTWHNCYSYRLIWSFEKICTKKCLFHSCEENSLLNCYEQSLIFTFKLLLQIKQYNRCYWCFFLSRFLTCTGPQLYSAYDRWVLLSLQNMAVMIRVSVFGRIPFVRESRLFILAILEEKNGRA